MDLSDIKAVLLDMDGTLVESHAAVERAWRTWSAEHGVDPDAVLAVAHGAPAETTVRRFLPAAETGIAAARQLALQYDDLSDVTAGPGAAELLGTLARRGLPWAVVTSADIRLANARLAAAGIVPPVLVTVEDIAAGKPAPDGYLKAAAILGVPPATCLVVEDAEVGVRAGRAAGARTAGLRGLEADLTVDTLADLARLLG
ncbi:hydrolase [Actinoplanes ianthinogenes]|uniref:Hydrolase n=1 Tax=Actinoplanes ianthinogenes TaxID=122358 RepID=A0ABN6CL84_9ACTN|nr:HAD-IA family hydrolase [Actinoplanes ianthinogenes]BCJ45792.1 hydrolase [Actinoplanes ianthinogenes]GGR31933.1 hydrolase [Actinoplanes ianthinogenes]